MDAEKMASLRAIVEMFLPDEHKAWLATVPGPDMVDTEGEAVDGSDLGHIFWDLLRMEAYLDGDERELSVIAEERIN